MVLFAGLLAALKGPNDLLSDSNDGMHLVLIAITWPFCIILLTLVMFIEVYKIKLCKKIEDKVNMIKKDPTSVGLINIKDLRLILFASKINAINVDDKFISKVKSSLIDRSFEDYLLKIKDK
jgi:hypothetical protein